MMRAVDPTLQSASAPLRLVVDMEAAPRGIERLAPHGSTRVGRWEISVNPAVDAPADYWIVFANARSRARRLCAPENTLFIAGEPAEKKTYPHRFYRQFHRIVDTHTGSRHPRIELSAPRLCWHVGLDESSRSYSKGWEELSQLAAPVSLENRISVVCSDAAHTPGQCRRLAFLAALKVRLGDRLVHFGRGFTPVEDKFTAIYGFRLHLVLENCVAEHYWTEKVSDALLGWAHPCYVGCPNLTDYFSKDSFTALDVNDPAAAAGLIAARLDRPVEESERTAVAGARDRVLNAHNPFVTWAAWADRFYDAGAAVRPHVVWSHKAFRPGLGGLIFRVRQRLGFNV